jgi:predicted dienelactone hydrolase
MDMPSRRRVLVGAVAATTLMQLGWTARATTLDLKNTAYRVLDMDWHDRLRDRKVPVRLYLPNATDKGHQAPLVVLSHGIGGSRYGYSYLGRHWASQGFASLHVQHVGSDRKIWTGGSPFALVDRLHAAAQEAEAIARVHDLHFALDQALGGEIAHLIDSNRIVAAGHSYGANTTLLAVGAQVIRQGQLLNLRDSRLQAAILISAPPFYGESSSDRILTPIRVHTLHITATDDVIRIPGYYSAAEDRIAIFDAVGSPRKMLAVFTGGSHSIFTDRAGTGGVLLNAQVKNATCELTAAFMHNALGNGEHGLRTWPSRHASILSRFTDSYSL